MIAIIVSIVAGLFSALAAWIGAQNNFILSDLKDRIERLENLALQRRTTHV